MPTTSAAEPDAAGAIGRFRADVLALGVKPTAAAPLALAVSGGPDSMAMLWLAAQAFPGSVIAATVDHGLRPQGADEAAMVAGWCAANGVSHKTLRIEGVPDGANIQAWARHHRYLLLRDWASGAGSPAIATAHHADDQAETFLMRAARGSGLAGLAAIRAVNDDAMPPIVRPLLAWRRAELAAIATDAGLPVATDPSNSDERYDRVRMRRWLEQAPWFDPRAVADTVGFIAEADRDLGAMTEWLWNQRARREGSALVLDVDGLPRELRRRLTRRAIVEARAAESIAEPAFSPASNVESLLDALDDGRAATQAGVLVRPKAAHWRFAKAPPRRSH